MHQTPEERMMSELQKLNSRFDGAETITIKGQDGTTPKRGEDYLTDLEVQQLKLEIGSKVLDYVLPRIPPAQHGKTPIPGIDFPTTQQVYQFIDETFETLKKQKLNRKQLAADVAEIIKNQKGLIHWNNIKDTPDFEKKERKLRSDIAQRISEVGGGGGTTFRITDESTTVSEHVRTLNFTGAGVAATYGNNGIVNITIAGGGVTFETPTGTVDGANKTFTVTATPDFVVVDGIMYFDGSGYSIAGLTVTTVIAPAGFIRAAS